MGSQMLDEGDQAMDDVVETVEAQCAGGDLEVGGGADTIMEDATNSKDNTPTDAVEQQQPASIDAEGRAAAVTDDDEPPASKSSSAAESDDTDDNDDDDEAEDEDLVDRRSSSKGFPRPRG